MNKKALIAMSGGVDSSVAAFLMKQQGYDLTGITLKLFNNEDVEISREKSCCSLEDVEDARSVAYRLGIPYYVYNFTDQFKNNVIDRFINSYMNGSTPNPCIDCNRYIKFEHLMLRAMQLDFDFVVTGHYAIIENDATSGRYLLKKAEDETKDQSYVLYSMTQKQLAMTLFPLGNLRKSEVRYIAESNGFINANKRDSQDICFVRDGDYAGFIEQYTGQKFASGDFVNKNGNILGTHKGIIRYTIGQRKGLGISSSEPMYVCDILPEDNQVILGNERELYSKSLIAKQINLIPFDRIDSKIKVKAKIRYGQKEQSAMVEQLDEDTLRIEFDTPQRAITKGQSVVLYDGDYVIGGGIIA
ncbi:MAG: tRNA 2-thiouridine(34) synthase MnmA [Eubacteriales bacterium]|nr:tRNA 2-thiouridine(34) synthase MnmA [Eubacteriales bacterium]